MDLTDRYLPQAEFLIKRGYFSGDKYELARELEQKKKQKPKDLKQDVIVSNTVN